MVVRVEIRAVVREIIGRRWWRDVPVVVMVVVVERREFHRRFDDGD